MLLSAVPLFFVDGLIASQINGCYISRTFYCFSLKLIAIANIVTNDFLGIQFVYTDISFALDISVNCTAFYALMTHHISVN